MPDSATSTKVTESTEAAGFWLPVTLSPGQAGATPKHCVENWEIEF